MSIARTIKLMCLVLFLLLTAAYSSNNEPIKIIHVFVALCDNQHQGIIPVPPMLGNGEDVKNNLYWGAQYGIKTFFKDSPDWKLISTIENPKGAVLERCIFRSRSNNVYLIADAYRGIAIEQAVSDFLRSAFGNFRESISVGTGSQKIALNFAKVDLVAYVGHNGLMDFQIDSYPEKIDDKKRDAIVLACISKSYFREPLSKAGANPILWTTGLMAPEAYTLKAAFDGWILNETQEQIRERAANAYNKYQRCGLAAAKRLLVAGW